MTLTLLLVATCCSGGDLEFNSLPRRCLICSSWGRLSTCSFHLPAFDLFSPSVRCSVFFFFHSFWCCRFLAFIKGGESWCNSVFRHIQMQLYHSTSGSIKGHFKIQLFFPLFASYTCSLTTFFPPSISSSFFFSSLCDSLRHSALPQLYPITTIHSHPILLSSVIPLSSSLCSGTCSRILDCNGYGLAAINRFPYILES